MIDSLHQTIVDISQITGLILVFVTTLFGLRYPAIVSDLEHDDVPSGKKDRARFFRKLWISLVTNCLPPLALDAASLFVLSPLVVRIATISSIQLWNFDVYLSAFMFVVWWILGFFVWTALLSVRLLAKILHLKRQAH